MKSTQARPVRRGSGGGQEGKTVQELHEVDPGEACQEGVRRGSGGGQERVRRGSRRGQEGVKR
eukprot:782030-Prorocentrum_minimum.AAC.1